MKYTQYLEDKEKVEIVDIKEKLSEDQTARDDWDSQAEDGWRIRNNQLPLGESTEELKNNKGFWFIDNWVNKSFKWVNSYFTGADVYAEVESESGIIEPNMELVENTVNYAKDKDGFTNKVSAAYFDVLYTGIGAIRTLFNHFKINSFWKTGTPEIEQIDSRNVWFKCTDSNLTNVVRTFHGEAMDTEDARRMIAMYDPITAEKLKDDTSASAHGRFTNVKKQVVVYTYCYKKTVRVEKRELIITLTDYETKETTEERMFVFEEEYQDVIDLFDDKIKENIAVAPKTIKTDEDLWFQTLFIPSQNIIIKQPTMIDGEERFKDIVYVGNKNPLHLIGGEPEDGSSYPFGQAYYLKDVLDLSIIIMTTMSKQIGEMNRPTPEVFADALVDYNDFMNNHGKTGYVVEKDPDFFRENKHINPTEVVHYNMPPINAQLFTLIQSHITELIKTHTGAVDSARGEMQYSGQSGVLSRQLQMASQTYLESDKNKYEGFLNSILDWLMCSLVEFRQFPHKIQGNGQDLTPTARDVNTNIHNTLKSDSYKIRANMQPNPEIIKQTEKQIAIELAGSGKLSTRTLLKIIDLSSVNVDREMQQIAKEQGSEQIIELIDKYPEIQGQIMQMVQQIEQSGNAK
jgi:hypothetical protein